MSSNEGGTQAELNHYLSDPEHKELNRHLSRIKDPVKRRNVMRLIERVARVSGDLEAIRASVLKQ
ncbi:MAG: hypothetical protein EP347_09500 [Alphaproteobacteria bacterium]|nr:MAG: hypothetical protein EP347_09500 [Alphaproteobacteria bacterium]